ncbi:Pkinase-domain-containing protein [Patellaria atrata CBS 101060]|uniref:non-specific serine/threonine protein kinase n=1 Tax=Patellaria atrata CBS 101060 TaxID=1346257 RepID=A0A9P4S3Q8_9PEZI|nr:Pkinase-domain-containing protein [Patellaria atrata CBS 101060]
MAVETSRTRFSFDQGSMKDMEPFVRSPIVSEHEHGLGFSGLRRIRQQPSSRTAGAPGTSTGMNSRSSSMNLSLPATRHPSTSFSTGPASPTLNFSEDLTKFPSESLHSFSFAHQSEESIYNRQNILKRSIDFMRDKLGWAASHPGIVNAQAKLSGDQDLQSMMELLTRANLLGEDAIGGQGMAALGPLTGPADMSGENVFERDFMPRSVSPDSLLDPESPRTSRTKISDGVDAADTTLTLIDTADSNSSFVEASSPPLHLNDLNKTRATLKRTYTDTAPLTIQSKLTEALAQPYVIGGDPHHVISPKVTPHQPEPVPSIAGHSTSHPAPHGHGSRWVPAAQAIFTTESHAPWTITAANDLACLVFGVTRAEVRKLGILEVVKEERRKWLEKKLQHPEGGESKKEQNKTTSLAVGNGITARLLSKPSSRQVSQSRRAQTDDGSGSTFNKKTTNGGLNHTPQKSRGVLLCGDVVPIQKRNGAIGAASLWVKEKRGGLIWVLEEIAEDVVYVGVDEVGCVTQAQGPAEAIWGIERVRRGMDIKRLVPGIPRRPGTHTGALDFDQMADWRSFTARTSNSINIPVTVQLLSGEPTLRVSSFPHIAGMMVLSASSLNIASANSVFSEALFGQGRPEGLHISSIIPGFDKVLKIMTDEDEIKLVDGIVIPEHSFRRARAILAMREGKADAAAVFLRPSGLLAKHRDGNEIMVDVQMRVVKSEKATVHYDENVITEQSEDEADSDVNSPNLAGEVVYALWITYSRQLHAQNHGVGPVTPMISRPGTPPKQPSPGQTILPIHPAEADASNLQNEDQPVSLLAQQLKNARAPSIIVPPVPRVEEKTSTADKQESGAKKSISDFVVLEDMGQGAYGQVKLCRYKKNSSKKMVIKYVTKRRILVDTWTRDRRLGTVPLEIHVLDYLRRDGLKHPNIVEMADFFEDDVNYYIEMLPHGLPGMDLFDYIELRVNMDEEECQKIFVQVAEALHHLHTKAKVVHRDIKDENVILDGEGNIKLIDFGSAAYIKNGPFDVFVGTIDYAAPEVLAGKSYRGKEQDVWALGILLYTIVYKENPFYSIDEIMDHDLRVPYIMSEDCIDLIRLMLNRDVDQRITITQVLEHPFCKNAPE